MVCTERDWLAEDLDAITAMNKNLKKLGAACTEKGRLARALEPTKDIKT